MGERHGVEVGLGVGRDENGRHVEIRAQMLDCTRVYQPLVPRAQTLYIPKCRGIDGLWVIVSGVKSCCAKVGEVVGLVIPLG